MILHFYGYNQQVKTCKKMIKDEFTFQHVNDSYDLQTCTAQHVYLKVQRSF